MERKITLGEPTEKIIKAILDLEAITNEVFVMIRKIYAPDDAADDDTGSDIADASRALKDVLIKHLNNMVSENLDKVSNISNNEAII